MGDFLFALVLVVFSTLFFADTTSEYEVSTYNMRVQMKVKHVSLETAGKLETALHEWFGEFSLIEVTLEPDTTK